MLDPGRDLRKSGVELGRILAARLGEIGAPPAAAADLPGHVLDELARLEASRQVPGDGGNQIDLAVRDGPETDHTRAQLVAQEVHHRAEPFRVETAPARGRQLPAGHSPN